MCQIDQIGRLTSCLIFTYSTTSAYGHVFLFGIIDPISCLVIGSLNFLTITSLNPLWMAILFLLFHSYMLP